MAKRWRKERFCAEEEEEEEEKEEGGEEVIIGPQNMGERDEIDMGTRDQGKRKGQGRRVE